MKLFMKRLAAAMFVLTITPSLSGLAVRAEEDVVIAADSAGEENYVSSEIMPENSESVMEKQDRIHSGLSKSIIN